MELTSCESKKKGRVPVREKPAFRKPVLNVLQPELLARPLEELIPEEDPCRLVMKMVSLVDLSKLRGQLKKQGAPYYPLEVMLALEMFSKWDGEFGSRRVEKRCNFDVRYQFVCQGHRPDHTTIWRFRRFLGTQLEVFLAEAVRLGREGGLVSLGRVSLDGTKLPGAASQWRAYRKISEEEDQDLTAKLEKTIEKEPETEPSPEEAAIALIEASKSSRRKGEPLPSKDPEAVIMKATKGHYLLGYNAQVAMDQDTGMVMACHVTNAASDSHLLAPTLEQYLDVHHELPSDLVADAGYDTPFNARLLADLGIDAVIANPERRAFWRLDEQDKPICPAGHLAVRESQFMKKEVMTLRLIVKECPGCPLREKCLAQPNPKTLPKHRTLSFDAQADPANWIRQREKARTDEGKERLKERSQTIEFCFAKLKERLKFKRISMWGLKGAKTEIAIMVIALNFANLLEKIGTEKLEELYQAFLCASQRLFRTSKLILAEKYPPSLLFCSFSTPTVLRQTA